jgi:hypothetical protein
MAGVHKLKVKLLHVSFFSMRILKISTRDVREAVDYKYKEKLL